MRYVRINNEIVCTTEAYDTKYIVILEILIEQKRVVSVVCAVCLVMMMSYHHRRRHRLDRSGLLGKEWACAHCAAESGL